MDATNQPSAGEVILEFQRAMEAVGIITKDKINADGKLHRVHIEGDRNGSRNGWYILHLDGRPFGAFGCWKQFGKESIKWSMAGVKRLSAEERKVIGEKIRADRIKRERQQREQFEYTAMKAAKIWDAAAEALDQHPYLLRKKVPSYGLRMVPTWVHESLPDENGEVFETKIQNALLVPIRKNASSIVSLQAIFPSSNNVFGRDKSFMTGGEKQGCYHVIGKPTGEGAELTILIGEGYSTCASAHRATGLLTIVAFDAGNFLAVARKFRQRLPDARIVFIADNDQWTTHPIKNPGVTRAKEASDAVKGIIAIPKFPDELLNGKPTDFNDLDVMLGAEEVRRQILGAIEGSIPPPEDPPWDEMFTPRGDDDEGEGDDDDDGPPDGGDDDGDIPEPNDARDFFRILGADRDGYYVYQNEMNQVLEISASALARDSTYTQLAPLDWWEREFPGDKGFNKKMAMNWLQRTAQRRHDYHRRMFRGRGAWLDDGRSVYHFGNELLVDGKAMPLEKISSKFIYERGEPLPQPTEKALTADEGARLLDVAKMFRWVRPASAPLLLGWCALAPFCGALPWRPHIWLTGGPGSGKSTIQAQFVDYLMAGTALYAQGSSTEAGIRQELKSDAVPVLFDESEQNNDRERARIESVLALIRQSSTESRARTLKGTMGGDSMAFVIKSMFCLASIQVGIKQQADRERLTILALKGKRPEDDGVDQGSTWKQISDALYVLHRDKKMPARIMRRMINMMPVLLHNISVFVEVGAARFGSQREGDQYGTLLAGAWTLTNDAKATIADAEKMIDSHDWSDHIDNSEADEDQNRALSALMGAQIRLAGGIVATVYELVSAAAGYEVKTLPANIQRSDADAIIRRYGMRVEGDDGKSTLPATTLLLANSSVELVKLVDGTPYESDLKGQLLRTRGAKKGTNEDGSSALKKFNGVTSRYITIPLSQIIDAGTPGDGEQEEFPL